MQLPKSLAALAIAGLAVPAAAASEAQAPLARVAGNSVIHSGESLAVHVPKTATHAGSRRFVLYDVADAEVHVFIEADSNRRMQRVYWIQFESYLPSKPELAYNYAKGNRRVTLGGTTTWLRSSPVPTTGPMRTGSDREHVFEILKRGGYTIPDEVMNVRLVQILDDPQGTGKGRRELMIIYSEDLAPTGKTLADLTTDGKPNPAWAPLEQELIQRATEALRVERL